MQGERCRATPKNEACNLYDNVYNSRVQDIQVLLHLHYRFSDNFFLILHFKLDAGKRVNLLHELWVPESSFIFPVSGKRHLKFQFAWLLRWTWLAYSSAMMALSVGFASCLAVTVQEWDINL